ncbi:MAG: hypothetical protein V2A73_12440 [Pseudomonadota bacterium]
MVENRRLCLSEPFFSALIFGGERGWHSLPLGAIVAVCELWDVAETPPGFVPRSCRGLAGMQVPLALGTDSTWNRERESAFGDYSPGRFAWYLGDVRRLPEPIECRGSLSLWNVPPEIEAAVRAQVGE